MRHVPRPSLGGPLAWALLAWTLAGCAPTPHVPPTLHARAVGYESHEAPTPVWSRWARVSELRFLEVVVGTDDVEQPLPLLLSLHGIADHPRVPGPPMLSLPRAYRLVMPEGPVELESGEHAWSHWRVRDEHFEELGDDLERNVAPLAELVRVVQLARPTRGLPILMGFSQGGHQAFLLGVRHPELFSLVVPMAAWIDPARLPSPRPESRTPFRGVHARDDERVASAQALGVYAQLAAAGWDAQLEVIEGTHAPSPALDAFVSATLGPALRRLLP